MIQKHLYHLKTMRYLCTSMSLIIVLALGTIRCSAAENVDVLLLESAYHNNFKKVVHYHNNGADINYSDKSGWSALSWSVSNHNLKMSKFLVEHKANVFSLTSSRGNLLHIALAQTVSLPILKQEDKLEKISASQRYKMVKYLLKIKIDPNMEDEFGSLPIHYAAALSGVSNQQIDLLRLLLLHGSYIDKKNDFGFTPLDLSESIDVKQYLKSKNKSQN